MDAAIIVAIITAGVSLVSTVVVFLINENAKRARAWQKRKLSHYKVLLSTLSDLAVDGKNKDRANEAFSAASNTIALIASQEVITALMQFHNLVKLPKSETTTVKYPVI